MTPKLSDEIWMAAKIKAAGVKWQAFEGLLSSQDRKERIREAIKRSELAQKFIDGDVTFAEYFKHMYREAL